MSAISRGWCCLAAAWLAGGAPLWHHKEKPASIILVVDRSAAMQGKPLQEAMQAATALLASLDPTDEVSLIAFDTKVDTEMGPFSGDRAGALLQKLPSVAAGGSALYDAVVEASSVARARTRALPGRTQVVVVLTAGRDDSSHGDLPKLLALLEGKGTPPAEAPARSAKERQHRARVDRLLASLPVAPPELTAGLDAPAAPLYLLSYGGPAQASALSRIAAATGGIALGASGQAEDAVRAVQAAVLERMRPEPAHTRDGGFR